MADDPKKTDDAPKAADPAPVPAEKPHPLDDVLGDVKGESDVRSAVHALVEKLGDEFASPDLQERADVFADAVAAKVSGTDTPFKAPQPATDEDVKRLEEMNHSAPHNEAAAAAVDAGMDIRTANDMTAVGSNI